MARTRERRPVGDQGGVQDHQRARRLITGDPTGPVNADQTRAPEPPTVDRAVSTVDLADVLAEWDEFYVTQLGAPVFLIWWVEDGVCACGTDCGDQAGKHPIGPVVPNGVNNATLDLDLIRRWRSRYPKANTGLATGVTFDVLDLDQFLTLDEVDALADADTHDGDDPIATICRAGHGDVASWLAWGELGPVSKTGNGRHVLVQPTGFSNKAGVKSGLPVHVDWRGKGGYIIAPPSTHRTGRRYQWLDGFPATATIPAAPDAVVRMLVEAEERTRRPSITDRLERLSDPVASFLRSQFRDAVENRSPRYAIAALEAEAADVASTPPKGRNDRLNVAAIKLGRFVLSGELTEAQVYDALVPAALRSGLGERESVKTVRSGLFGATKKVAA